MKICKGCHHLNPDPTKSCCPERRIVDVIEYIRKLERENHSLRMGYRAKLAARDKQIKQLKEARNSCIY